MYFIYLLILFAINFIACFFGKMAFDVQSDGYMILFVFQFIFLATCAAILIVCVGQQLNLHSEFYTFAPQFLQNFLFLFGIIFIKFFHDIWTIKNFSCTFCVVMVKVSGFI